MQNPSIVLRGPARAAVEDRPVPTITGDNDVIVRVAYTGVCGSDVSFACFIYYVLSSFPLSLEFLFNYCVFCSSHLRRFPSTIKH